jgi:hypothetical protein
MTCIKEKKLKKRGRAGGIVQVKWQSTCPASEKPSSKPSIAGGVAQVVEHLPSIREALSSNPSTNHLPPKNKTVQSKKKKNTHN